jgi:hypothetical protein
MIDTQGMVVEFCEFWFSRSSNLPMLQLDRGTVLTPKVRKSRLTTRIYMG